MPLLKIPFIPGVRRIRVRSFPAFLDLALLEVSPAMRGQGVGSRVLDFLKRFERPLRVQACADSDAEQPALERFYARQGFVPVQSALPACFEWRPTP